MPGIRKPTDHFFELRLRSTAFWTSCSIAFTMGMGDNHEQNPVFWVVLAGIFVGVAGCAVICYCCKKRKNALAPSAAELLTSGKCTSLSLCEDTMPIHLFPDICTMLYLYSELSFTVLFLLFKKIAYEQERLRDFDEAVSKALLKHINANNDYNTNLLTSSFETLSGDFDVKYVDNIDNEREMSMFMKILLKDNTSCYKIEGESSDANVGSATITEGFATYSGIAWWVEETFSGTDKGLKILSEGIFDLARNTFTGTWKANTGICGSYTDFKGSNVYKTFSPGHKRVSFEGDKSPGHWTVPSNPKTLEGDIRQPLLQK